MIAKQTVLCIKIRILFQYKIITSRPVAAYATSAVCYYETQVTQASFKPRFENYEGLSSTVLRSEFQRPSAK